ncbi:MAG: DUF4442 domain-containing protein [Bdellovibrionota bacterium]
MKPFASIDMESLKMTALINGMSLAKLPLLAFISPRVVKCTGPQSIVQVGLGFRTRNHLGVMYFGALAMGAELSIALKAVQEIQRSGQRIDFLFKNFKCEFHKRADGDVQFICDEAEAVAELIQTAATSPDRMERTFKGRAIVPSKSQDSIMDYELTLTVKNRSIAAGPSNGSPKKSMKP